MQGDVNGAPHTPAIDCESGTDAHQSGSRAMLDYPTHPQRGESVLQTLGRARHARNCVLQLHSRLSLGVVIHWCGLLSVRVMQ